MLRIFKTHFNSCVGSAFLSLEMEVFVETCHIRLILFKYSLKTDIYRHPLYTKHVSGAENSGLSFVTNYHRHKSYVAFFTPRVTLST